jgi:hypothetical protein
MSPLVFLSFGSNVSNRKDIDRYFANRQKEIDGAALYLALAESEKQPQMSELYMRLSASEEKHAVASKKKLKALNVTIPARTQSARANIDLAGEKIWSAVYFANHRRE